MATEHGGDHSPEGSRPTTSPQPNEPLNSRPIASSVMSTWWAEMMELKVAAGAEGDGGGGGGGELVTSPFAFFSSASGIA